MGILNTVLRLQDWSSSLVQISMKIQRESRRLGIIDGSLHFLQCIIVLRVAFFNDLCTNSLLVPGDILSLD